MKREDIESLVDIICLREDIQPCIVKALIDYESSWQPTLIHLSTGGYGLLNIDKKKKQHIEALVAVWNERNIESYLAGAIRYLKYLLDIFHNKWFYVLIAWKKGVVWTIRFEEGLEKIDADMQRYLQDVLGEVDKYCK